MPNLSIKDVPEAVAEKLRQRAARNHRSLQGELMALITQAVAEEPERRHAPAGQEGATRPKTIEQIVAEHRARWPQPFDVGPRAVDIVRADRDTR